MYTVKGTYMFQTTLEVEKMEVSHIVAARKEHLLGKRQSLATEEVVVQT